MNKEKFLHAVNEYYDAKIPEPDENELNILKDKLRQQKNYKSNRKLPLKNIFIGAVSCLLIVLISIFLFLPKKEKYFLESDLEMVELNQTDAVNLLAEHFNEYKHIFDICELNSAFSYNSTNNNEPITIKYRLTKNDIPYTSIYLQIDLEKYFINNNTNLYKLDAEISNYSNFTLYEKTINEVNNENYMKFLDFGNYRIFLNLNIDDSEIFDIFIK